MPPAAASMGINNMVSKHMCSPLSSVIPDGTKVLIIKVIIITAAAMYSLPSRFWGHEESACVPILQMVNLRFNVIHEAL